LYFNTLLLCFSDLPYNVYVHVVTVCHSNGTGGETALLRARSKTVAKMGQGNVHVTYNYDQISTTKFLVLVFVSV
jgi:hypothetical protein